jgi:hypothetical protein
VALVPCAWCGTSLVDQRRGRFCGRRCRQSAWRIRRRRGDPGDAGPSLPPGATFAYADPPYPGLAHYYRDRPEYAGEVDHAALVASLTTSLATGELAGWALSTSAAALREILPLCPPYARVCAWVKPIGVSSRTYGLHSTWEPLIVVGGRRRRPGLRDWLAAQPARRGGELLGRKPLAFCAWLFNALGMVPGDELRDLYPGTGIVARAWRELSATDLPTTGACRRSRGDTGPSPGAGERARLSPAARGARRQGATP